MTNAIVPKELLTATVGGLSFLVMAGGAEGHVATQQADGTYAPEAVSAGIGGSVGATDNRLVRSDGTGGSTVQSTGITVDDSNNVSGVGTLYCSGQITAANTLRIGIETFSSMFSNGNSYDADGVRLVRVSNTYSYKSFEGSQIGARTSFLGYDGSSYYCQITPSKADFYSSPITGGSITVTGLMCAGVYTFATVPSASSNTGKFLRISDRAQKHAYSDGTNWRFFGDDAIIS